MQKVLFEYCVTDSVIRRNLFQIRFNTEGCTKLEINSIGGNEESCFADKFPKI